MKSTPTLPSPLQGEGKELSIRELTPADIPEVSELATRIWREHYAPCVITREQVEYMLPSACSRQAIAGQMAEKNQRCWLIYDGGALAGYVCAEPRSGGEWFIDKFYVDASRHRRGLGSALMAQLIRECRPKTLSLRTNRRNVKAINFYFKHGFFIEAMDVLDIGGGFVMDDFLMKKRL